MNRRSNAIGTFVLLGTLLGCGGNEAQTKAPAAPGEIKYSAEDRQILLQRLKSENPGERVLAAGVLGMLGSEAQDALPALAEAEKDPNPSVRAAVTKAIAAIKAGKPAQP